MAKRKKHRKQGTRRRHRGGSMLSGINATHIFAIAAGATAAGYANKVIPAGVNDKVASGVKLAIGIFLPKLAKSGNTKAILEAAGAGIIAVSSVDLLKSFGALSGDFDIPTINGDVLSGDDLAVINGTGENDDVQVGSDVLSGSDDEDDN